MIKAAAGRYVVKPYEPQVSEFIELDAKFKQSDQVGEIVDVGGEIINEFGTLIEPVYKVGDIIVHSPYLQEPYTHLEDSIRYRFIKFLDVNAVIKKDK